MKHTICDNKVVLGELRANKSLTATQRSSHAAYGVKTEFCSQYDSQGNIPLELSKHKHACTTDVVRDMITVIHGSEPFRNQPGRVLNPFPNIGKMSLEKLKVFILHTWLTHNKHRLFADQNYTDR